jgi:hypothetical protein
MTSFGTHTLRKPIAGGVHGEVWVKTESTVVQRRLGTGIHAEFESSSSSTYPK